MGAGTCVGVAVTVAVGRAVAVEVSVGVIVGVAVGDAVGVLVSVLVAVGVCVLVAVALGVDVVVTVWVGVAVLVAEFVGVGVGTETNISHRPSAVPAYRRPWSLGSALITATVWSPIPEFILCQCSPASKVMNTPSRSSAAKRIWVTTVSPARDKTAF